MANKRLSLQDIQLMKEMVLKSVAPEDIANHFGIAISSVHNYKNRFKADGMQFPNMRGKRPTGSVEVETKPVNAVKPVKEITAQTPQQVSSAMNFVVNGVAVQVAGNAKHVNISKDAIEINF